MIDRRLASSEADNWDIVTRYDALMFDPAHLAYFGDSDFTNFGYWRPDTTDQRQACETLMDVLMDMIPDKQGTILDVACGKGATTRHLMRWYRPEDVTAINISARQLQAAAENARGCTFRLMDAVNLEFDDASFDNIVCVEAAFHFQTREKFLREALRVLKPGGRLVLSDILMTLEAEGRKPYRSEANFLDGPAAYEDLARRAGFAEVKVVDATVPCWHGCYWYAVRFIHERFLARRIDQAGLKDFLKLTYRRAEDIRFYLLASLGKGVAS